MTNINKIGSQFRINTTTTNNQQWSAVTTLSNGDFVVTWTSDTQDGDGYGIYGQRYDANGNAISNEFQVNSNTTGHQQDSSITPLSDGGFVVTWQSQKDTISHGNGNQVPVFDVYGRRYHSNGNAVTDEFKVNTANDSLLDDYSSVTGLSNGGFVVTWTSYRQDYEIYGRRYDVNGSAINTQEFLVNTDINSPQFLPSVTGLSNGGFVVTWSSYGQDGNFYGIYGRRYDSNGSAIDSQDFQVNTYTTSDQFGPSVTGLRDGGFVVTWESSGQDGDGYGIYGRRYDVNGSAMTNEFRVNTYTTSDQRVSSVTPLSNGGFVVTWESEGQDGDGYGIYGRRYHVNGNPIDSQEFLVNTDTAAQQFSSSVTAFNDGGFVVTWTSDQGSNYDIYGQIFKPPVTYSVTTATTSINEGNSGSKPLTFTVTRENSSSVSSVGYVIAGNATYNSDYNNIQIGGVTGGVEGVINFSAGETSKAITLDVLGDTRVEAHETIVLKLRKPSLTSPESVISTDTASITITNDDSPISGENPTGDDGSNLLRGTANNNTLTGWGGNDRLLGFAGNDTLIGGPGADLLDGGDGGDIFVYQNLTDSLLNSEDRLISFSQPDGDRFRADFGKPLGLFNAGTFTTTSIADAVNAAYADADQATPGAQGLGINSAVFFGWRGRQYLSINDGTAGFQSNNDLVLYVDRFTFAAGTLNVDSYFI